MWKIKKAFFTNKKGFTLVELIAVITILGVLVLIATPNFLDTSRDVRGQEITYNVKIIEYNADMYALQTESDITDGLIEIDPAVIQAAYVEGRLFDSGGYAHISRLDGFYDLTGTEITKNMTSTTSGIYAIQDKTIYFIADKILNVAMEFNPDLDPPVITVGSYNTTPTNGNVTVCITINEGSANLDCYTFTENGSFEFIATDIAGNTATETVTIDFIDKTPPVITIGAYNTSPTNQDILVTATLDDGTFTSASSHTFTVNGSFTFTATDDVGNTSSETVVITNIDKIPPTTPVITADTSTGTGFVDIVYSTDSVQEEYMIDSGVWTPYTTQIVLNNNATVYARGIDEAGNVSSIAEQDVIVDIEPPVVTFATNGNTSPEKTQSTAVNVTDAKSGVDSTSLQYVWSTSTTAPGTGWASFSNGATLSQSTGTGTYYLHIKAADTIGNATTVSSNGFNVDNTPPVIIVDAYNTAPTNQDIAVTASTNEGTLNTTSHVFSENGSFTFTATDEAGNTSSETVTITNIDKIPPVITIGAYNSDPTNQNITVTATTNEGTLNTTSHIFTDNGSFLFTAIDAAGNSSSRNVTINNIDKVLPTVTFGTNGNATPSKSHSTTVSAADDIGVSTRQYAWSTSTVTPTAGWTSFANGAIITRNTGTGNYRLHIKATDTAGNVRDSYSNVFNVDNTPPAAPTLISDPHVYSGRITAIKAADAVTVEVYFPSFNTWISSANDFGRTLPTGETFQARAIDAAGNVSTVATAVATQEKVVKLSGGALQESYAAITENGNVYSWGAGRNGVLGQGNLTNYNYPKRIDPLYGKNIIEVDISYDHSIALGADGKVYTWGKNQYGQLGFGDTAQRNSPTELTFFNGKGVIDVAVSYFSSFAVTSSGDVYSWGSNYDGELGIGNKVDQFTPVKVTGASGRGVKSISANGDMGTFVIAVAPGTQKVYSWGANFNGQLGIGNTTDRTSPVEITGLSGRGVIKVSQDDRNAHALTSGGRVYAWGHGGYGRLGLGAQVQYTTPQLMAFTGIKDISNGFNAGFAVTTTGVVYSWGNNDGYHVGQGTADVSYYPSPTVVAGMNGKGSIAISAGYYSVITLTSSGDMYSWSDNADGQIALPWSITRTAVPIKITNYQNTN